MSEQAEVCEHCHRPFPKGYERCPSGRCIRASAAARAATPVEAGLAEAWDEGWSAGIDHACELASVDNPYRPTPTDQNAAESSGSDLEAEVGCDE